MKILILSTSDIDGGAARAAYRLHTSLLDAGIESQMLVKDKHSIDPTVICISNSKIQKGINALRPSIDRINVNRYKPRSLFSQSWVGFNGISEQINKINLEVVEKKKKVNNSKKIILWLNNNLKSKKYSQLRLLGKKIPVNNLDKKKMLIFKIN